MRLSTGAVFSFVELRSSWKLRFTGSVVSGVVVSEGICQQDNFSTNFQNSLPLLKWARGTCERLLKALLFRISPWPRGTQDVRCGMAPLELSPSLWRFQPICCWMERWWEPILCSRKAPQPDAEKDRNVMETETAFEPQRTFCLYTSTLGIISYYTYPAFHTESQNEYIYVGFWRHVVLRPPVRPGSPSTQTANFFCICFCFFPLSYWLYKTLDNYVQIKLLKENSDLPWWRYSRLGTSLRCGCIAILFNYIKHKHGAEPISCSFTSLPFATLIFPYLCFWDKEDLPTICYENTVV